MKTPYKVGDKVLFRQWGEGYERGPELAEINYVGRSLYVLYFPERTIVYNEEIVYFSVAKWVLTPVFEFSWNSVDIKPGTTHFAGRGITVAEARELFKGIPQKPSDTKYCPTQPWDFPG